MKTPLVPLTMLLSATMIGSALPSLAQERSTRSVKAVEQLMNRVDQTLQKHEQRTADQNPRIEAIDNKLEAALETYKSAEDDPDVQHDAKITIIEQLVDKNTLYRERISSTMTTIAHVSRDLKALSKELEKAGMTPEAVEKRRKRMATMLKSVGPIMANMRHNTPDSEQSPMLRAQMANSEQTLRMLYTRLTNPMAKTDTLFNQVEQTVDAMEETAAQLKIVKDLLDDQRYVIQLSGYNEMLWLSLRRLLKSNMSAGQLRTFASEQMSDVIADNDKYFDVLTSSPALDGGDIVDSPRDDQIMQNIYSGTIPGFE